MTYDHSWNQIADIFKYLKFYHLIAVADTLLWR